MKSETIKTYIDLVGKKAYAEYTNSHENRPTLVFLHDSLGCVKLWRDFTQVLAEAANCNVLVYDRLGYGKSDAMPTWERTNDYMDAEAETLNELLSDLGIENAILFGHSDGGSIALIAAAKFPNRIKAVICEAAHIFVEEITLKGIREAMVAFETTDLRERLKKYHGDKVEMLFKAWTLTWISDSFRSWNIEYLLPNVNCPLLFIQGKSDEFGSLEQVEKTVSQVSSRAETYILENIGHTPHKEAPDQTIEAAKRFIDSL
ncbi:alpha/beta hydrolase [Flavobacterium sp. MAH-1]|uniref:Alpha/beta hydrolase n=1 Tax=Flavobacterium agri TaxID=2743471 RepID=A0A7Y8Y0H9_9FLAO|nr:alpha/beta hydrolase [Flavobacterium agri]NUY80309.1 alpha/beta hydrolase [Flavobacterium agri]NYA70334.1 alpha/beta hydrolase [Flavobacterium agri]